MALRVPKIRKFSDGRIAELYQPQRERLERQRLRLIGVIEPTDVRPKPTKKKPKPQPKPGVLVDKRTKIGKEYKIYRDSLIEQLGGTVTPQQLHLIESAALLRYRILLMERESRLTPSGEQQLAHFHHQLNDMLRKLGTSRLHAVMDAARAHARAG